MIDFILFIFMLITLYIGFWLGAKYGTVKATGKAFVAWVNGFFSKT